MIGIAGPGPIPGVKLGVTSTTALQGNYGGIDDSTNASGLSTPAIIRGTVFAHLASGVTVGNGISTLLRQQNATSLQAAITYAVTNGKIFEIIPGTYEIDNSTGLIIPANQSGLIWKGYRGGSNSSTGSEIVQYNVTSPGTPVLTIGDYTSGGLISHMQFDGIDLRYGQSQPITNTSASTLVVGQVAWSSLDNIGIQPGGSYSDGAPQGNNGYRGATFLGGFFSNTCRNWIIWGAQQDLLYANDMNTGNVFDNFYLNNSGIGHHAPLAGSYLNLFNCYEGVWDQLNLEWGGSQAALSIANSGGNFHSLHCEGIEITGSNGTLLYMGQSAIKIDTWSVVDLKTSGGTTIVSDYDGAPGQLTVANFGMSYNSTGLLTGGVYFFYYQPFSFQPGDGFLEGFVTIDKGGFNLTSGGGSIPSFITMDNNMVLGTGVWQVPLKFERYSYGFVSSRIDKPMIPITANYAHYGQLHDAVLQITAVVTSFTITLKATMAATGTQPTDTGNTVRVTRFGGTQTGTVAVVDGPSAATLVSNVTGDSYFRFNGTNWVTFTAITKS